MSRRVPFLDAGDLLRPSVRNAAGVQVSACSEEMTVPAGIAESEWPAEPDGSVLVEAFHRLVGSFLARYYGSAVRTRRPSVFSEGGGGPCPRPGWPTPMMWKDWRR